MRSARPPAALMVECIDRLDGLEGFRLATFVWAWVLMERLDGEISIEDFAAGSIMSRATCYRRLATFREAFPEYGAKGTPRDLPHRLLEPADGGKGAARESLPRSRRPATS